MSTDLNLYNITEEYRQIADALIENGGELTPELETALAINRENLEVKTAKYAYVTKKFDGEALLIKNEIERLTGLLKARENASEKLKEKVKEAMNLFGITKVESQNIKLLIVPSKQTIIEDEAAIPSKYKIKVPATYKIDKNAIKNDLNAGKKIKGARIQENKNLRIS